MLFSSVLVPLFAGLASVVQAQGGALTPNTPNGVVFCQPTLLSWSGGTAPYFVKINQGGSTTNTLITLLSDTTATQFTWTTSLPANTQITLAVKDSTGLENFSGIATVAANPSGVTTCGAATPNNTVSASTPATTATGSAPAGGNSASVSATTRASTTGGGGSASAPVASASQTQPTGAGFSTVSSGGAVLLTALMGFLVHAAL